MRKAITPFLSVVFGVLAFTPSANAQADSAVAAVNAVVMWRVNWVQDPTPFDACAAFDAAGRPVTFPARIETHLRRFVIGSVDQCGSVPGQVRPTPGPNLNVVVIDSISLDATRGRVSATVYHGDSVHREEYTLSRPGRWVVTEMRMWGAETVSYRRPPRTER